MIKGTLENICVSYDGKTNVLEGLNLDIREGELLSLLGPSGCGKSTTLRVIAGFVEQSAGTFMLDGKDMSNIPVHDRDFGLVFQSYALFPHLSVYDNIAFGLNIRKMPKDQQKLKIQEIIDVCGLEGFEDRYPKQLSGGQRQRVALARALVVEPKLLLLDEPLSNLDAQLRLKMRQQIREIQQKLKITTIFVTHDQEECFSISDRVAIINKGIVEQLDIPEVIYSQPKTEYVARFVGFDNFIDVDNEGMMNNNQKLVLTEDINGFTKACIRPDDILIVDNNDCENCLSGEVLLSTFLGKFYQIDVKTDVGVLKVDTPLALNLQKGDSVNIHLPAHKIVLV